MKKPFGPYPTRANRDDLIDVIALMNKKRKKTIEELLKANRIEVVEQRLNDWCVWKNGTMYASRSLRGAIEQARQGKRTRLEKQHYHHIVDGKCLALYGECDL